MEFTRIRNMLEIISTVMVILASGVLVWTLLFRSHETAPASLVTDVSEARIDADAVRKSLGNGQIVIVEFSDYQCPFCAAHAKQVFPTIERDLVRPGRVRYVAFNFPLAAVHPMALQAAEAAECAGHQNQFWLMQDLLFRGSPDKLTRKDLTSYAALLKVDVGKFEECLDSGTTRDMVAADRSQGLRLGVRSTPTFFLGLVRPDGALELTRRISGAAPFEVFKEEVEDLHKQ